MSKTIAYPLHLMYYLISIKFLITFSIIISILSSSISNFSIKIFSIRFFSLNSFLLNSTLLISSLKTPAKNFSICLIHHPMSYQWIESQRNNHILLILLHRHDRVLYALELLSQLEIRCLLARLTYFLLRL